MCHSPSVLVDERNLLWGRNIWSVTLKWWLILSVYQWHAFRRLFKWHRLCHWIGKVFSFQNGKETFGATCTIREHKCFFNESWKSAQWRMLVRLSYLCFCCFLLLLFSQSFNFMYIVHHSCLCLLIRTDFIFPKMILYFAKKKKERKQIALDVSAVSRMLGFIHVFVLFFAVHHGTKPSSWIHLVLVNVPYSWMLPHSSCSVIMCGPPCPQPIPTTLHVHCRLSPRPEGEQSPIGSLVSRVPTVSHGGFVLNRFARFCANQTFNCSTKARDLIILIGLSCLHHCIACSVCYTSDWCCRD